MQELYADDYIYDNRLISIKVSHITNLFNMTENRKQRLKTRSGVVCLQVTCDRLRS